MRTYFIVILLFSIIMLNYNSKSQDFKRVEKNAGFHETIPIFPKVNFKEKRCYRSDNKDTNGKSLEYIIKYENGNEIEKYEFWFHNETVEKYKYDRHGKKISGSWIETKYYDEYGNFIPEVSGKFKYKYDKNNNLIRESKLTSKGEIIETHIYIYDRENRIVEEEIMNNFDSEANEKFKYKYDKEANYMDKISIYKNGNTSIHRFIYDSTNKLIEKYDGYGVSSETFKSGYIFKYLYFYKNEILQEYKCMYWNDHFNFGVIFKYDTLGNLIYEGSYHKEGEIEDIVIYEYSY